MKNLKSLFPLALLLVIGFLHVSVSAKDVWLQVRTKNFNLIGNASEKDVRKVATKLEQFRDTFRQLFPQTMSVAGVQTNVVVFKSVSAYKPFLPKRGDGKADTNIAGYFMPGEDVNYITISTEGEDADTYGTIFHEYVHSLVNNYYGKSDVPPWFNEGLAEFYQTFAIEKDIQVQLGLPQSGHVQLLQQSQLIPLDTFFKITNYSLHQNGNHSRSIFYAQSWALIHYLIQTKKNEGLAKFLTLRMKDVPAKDAFQEAFQTTYEQMEKDLRKYVSKNTYLANFITFKNKLVFDNEMQVSALSEAESNTYLGDLLYHTNRYDDAEAYLQKAVALDPNLSMANTTFGMVKMQQKKYAEAKPYLEKAISADQKSHLAFYNYAYLLSREDRDEFGYVSSYPEDKAAKMRDLLVKAIAANPAFTESYELLAYVNLVNDVHLDESIAYLQKALKYQPGNQRYAIRIAEIFMRQDKFAEAAAIADKIARTADNPQVKSQAENLAEQLRRRQEMMAQNEASRKQYETAVAEARKNGGQPVFVRRGSNERTPTPEELLKAEEEAKLRMLNQSIRKAAAGEKQVIGRIQKIECKGKAITYTIKTEAETFTLSSKDFENLIFTAFIETDDTQIGCGASLAVYNSVLTYKPLADSKNVNRGELIAVEFVTKDFRFMTASEIRTAGAIYTEGENTTASNSAPPASTASANPASASPANNEDLKARRREMMMQSIKGALREPLLGEIQVLGFIEKAECNSKGMFFHFKAQNQNLKLLTSQDLMIRSFTPDMPQMRFGCDLKPMDFPVVITYKESADAKKKSGGELISMEFVPKSFTLE